MKVHGQHAPSLAAPSPTIVVGTSHACCAMAEVSIPVIPALALERRVGGTE